MAPRDGFEPPLPVLETGVLPLDDRGVRGAAGRNRTDGLRVTSALLYLLSYGGKLERVARIELASSGWKPDARPLSHTRVKLVAGAGNAPAATGL